MGAGGGGGGGVEWVNGFVSANGAFEQEKALRLLHVTAWLVFGILFRLDHICGITDHERDFSHPKVKLRLGVFTSLGFSFSLFFIFIHILYCIIFVYNIEKSIVLFL